MLFSPKMKKGATVSKSAVISTSETSMKIRPNVDPLRTSQRAPKVLSTVLNRKTKSSQDLELSKTKPSSSSSSKLFVGRKSSLEDSFQRCNADDLSSRQMHESLIRLRENAIQPFTFLNNILDERTSDDHVPIRRIKATEIDLQLAALTRRVQLNKSLLERTNERVKEINFLVERNAMMASRELNYDNNISEHTKGCGRDADDNESALNNACPGIMELKRTISVTKEMLNYVKKICNNEMEISDLPQEISNHMTQGDKKL